MCVCVCVIVQSVTDLALHIRRSPPDEAMHIKMATTILYIVGRSVIEHEQQQQQQVHADYSFDELHSYMQC